MNMFEFDDELAGMVNYTDETVPQKMPAMERKVHEAPKAAPKQSEPVDAQHVPVAQKERDFMERLKSCTAWGLICGGICMLMWLFEVNGLMAMEAAYPCILASAMVGTGGAVWSLK
jgi:hypothetical protein